jgi:hypothetical protein
MGFGATLKSEHTCTDWKGSDARRLRGRGIDAATLRHYLRHLEAAARSSLAPEDVDSRYRGLEVYTRVYS